MTIYLYNAKVLTRSSPCRQRTTICEPVNSSARLHPKEPPLQFFQSKFLHQPLESHARAF